MNRNRLIAITLLTSAIVACAWLLSGCASLTTLEADRTWEHLGRPEDGADTPPTVDANGFPSFGPKLKTK